MGEKVCSDAEEGGVNWLWTHTRGGEESWVEVKCIAVDSGGALIEISPSWKSSYRETVTEGHTIGIEGDQDHHWYVMCTDINTSQGKVTIKICYKEDVVLTCADHTNESDCIANHCHWYNGACHGEPLPDECSDYDTQSTCEAAGCKWENGACVPKDGEPIPDDATQMEIDREVSIFGVGFEMSALNCERGEAVVEAVGTGIRRVVILGGAMTIFPIGAGAIYLAAVWVNDQCTEIGTRAMNAPPPEEKGPDTDSGKSIPEMDEDKFDKLELHLEPEELAEIDMEELKRRDIVAHSIPTGNPQNDGTFSPEQWKMLQDLWKQLMEDVAAGRKTMEQAWREWDEAVIDTVVDTFIIEKFTLIAPSVVMAGSNIAISGRTPKKNMRIQIVAVKKWLGYDWAATDKVLKEVTSNELFQYETTLALEDFGAISIYARAPKERYEFWVEDHETDKVTVWVLTWTVVFALLLAIGLVFEKKYNKLGIFKKRK